ncbi:hypothetical protein IWW36_004742 [Coemansia brasiliensis]|uniref:Uncharacterized protein n=1 Tax=Coemansia brasiliensis TaxID=2650707 RepID=A0A9W8I544_9FUNG|nr:hypothetical protein IWW36_004742 [Coemansia brasiliensis]
MYSCRPTYEYNVLDSDCFIGDPNDGVNIIDLVSSANIFTWKGTMPKLPYEIIQKIKEASIGHFPDYNDTAIELIHKENIEGGKYEDKIINEEHGILEDDTLLFYFIITFEDRHRELIKDIDEYYEVY